MSNLLLTLVRFILYEICAGGLFLGVSWLLVFWGGYLFGFFGYLL